MSARRKGPVGGRLADLPLSERPREKLFAKGGEALSDEELLAILLGTGRTGHSVLETAREILQGGDLGRFFRRSAVEVQKLTRGIGQAKAARLAAVLEIARRLARTDLAGSDAISDPEAAARYLMTSLAAESREVMGGLLLDAKNRLIRDVPVFFGTATHASVAPAPLFRHAIQAGAVSLVLYHNHPSGDPNPSPDDDATTRRFVAAGREIGIEVSDHIVVGRGAWFSYRERGRLT